MLIQMLILRMECFYSFSSFVFFRRPNMWCLVVPLFYLLISSPFKTYRISLNRFSKTGQLLGQGLSSKSKKKSSCCISYFVSMQAVITRNPLNTPYIPCCYLILNHNFKLIDIVLLKKF